MADRRRNRPTNPSSESTAPLSGEIPVDHDTAAALAMFNDRLAKQAEAERAGKRVERATRAKDAAAARVREIEADTKATAEQRAEATAAYRDAVDALDRAKKGEPDPPRTAAEPATEPDTAAEDAAPSEGAVQPADTEDTADAAESA